MRKAGIIKKNVPVVISEIQEEIEATVFKAIAEERNVEIIFAENEIEKVYKTSLIRKLSKSKNVKGSGCHNQGIIRGFDITENHIEDGLDRCS